MKERGLFRNRKGGMDILHPTVMFIILNLLFFSILLVFVVNSSDGSLVYEQKYAKQIGLLLDKAKPDMQINMSFDKAIEIANEKELDLDRLVFIDNGRVLVKLSEKRGYSFQYFSNYSVESHIEGNLLILNINEKVIKNE